MTHLYRGWYQLAFERELKGPLTAVSVGGLSLMLVRRGDEITAFDAVCPHRSAHLAYGGRIDGDVIVCPFHGRRIGLGGDAGCALTVHPYQTLTVGGLVFALLGEEHDRGLRRALTELDRTHYFVQGFTVTAGTQPEMVIENGFDPEHFRAVHGLARTPELHLGTGSAGEMVVEGTFHTPSFHNAWNEHETAIRFSARVFSPNLCVTTLQGGGQDYRVISAATPIDDRSCTVRVSLALPPGPNGEPPNPQLVRSLLRDSKLAYDQDVAIWEHLDPDGTWHLDADDELVIVFRRFCNTFVPSDHARSARKLG